MTRVATFYFYELINFAENKKAGTGIKFLRSCVPKLILLVAITVI